MKKSIDPKKIKGIAFPQSSQQAGKIKQETDAAIIRLKQGNPPFNCKKCGTLFQPSQKQWIFHLLCDFCFNEYDKQKMEGRRNSVYTKDSVSQYFEDCDLWIKSKKT